MPAQTVSTVESDLKCLRYSYSAKFVYPGPWDEFIPREAPDVSKYVVLNLGWGWERHRGRSFIYFTFSLPQLWILDNVFRMSLSTKLGSISSFSSHVHPSTFIPIFVSGPLHSQVDHLSLSLPAAREMLLPISPKSLNEVPHDLWPNLHVFLKAPHKLPTFQTLRHPNAYSQYPYIILFKVSLLIGRRNLCITSLCTL